MKRPCNSGSLKDTSNTTKDIIFKILDCMNFIKTLKQKQDMGPSLRLHA